MSFLRRYTFKLYPNAVQDATLREQLLMMGQLWNALLQRREDVYRREGRTCGKREQYKEITQLRAECPEWAALSVAAARGVADRLDNAFQAFFRRAKAGAGAQSGYPRYKRADRCTSISFAECSGKGWRIWQKKPGKGGWRVYVKGVPAEIKARGLLPAEPKSWHTGEVIWRDGAWWLSVVAEMEPRRKAGTEQITISFDLIDEFARVERANGESLAGSKEHITPTSPRLESYLGPDTPDLRGDENTGWKRNAPWPGPDTPDLRGDENVTASVLQSNRDRRYRKFSWRWRREKNRIARHQAIEARQRKYAHHVWTTEIIRRASDLTITAPDIPAWTASPRGDARCWGANVAAVSSLNRHVRMQAPMLAVQMLQYKAEEAGIRCDVVKDEAPKIAVGRATREAGKTLRRISRKIRRAANGK